MAEVLKTKPIAETLFVGVGGVGSEIITKVSKLCKGEELRNIRFVALDTDAGSLVNIGDLNANITRVQTSSGLTVKEYLDKDDDARCNWFPNNSTLYGKTVSQGAGQVRAISRLALNNAIRTGEINRLYNVIDSLLLKDSGNFKQALRVVIVSSATGGTGSGMAMITSMLIREYLHEHYSERKSVIRGFFVLPSVMDTVITSQSERESQYRNGYATIKEINAFMMIASGFGGTENSLKRFNNLSITVPTPTGESKKLSCLPFDFCFLLENADKNSEGLGTLEAYKDSAALSIYEQSIGPMQTKSFSLEDNIIKEFAQKNKFARNRFGGIGASKIVYPYEDIADYVAYSRAARRIGGINATGDWTAYDKAYQNDMNEYAKKRLVTNEKKPQRSTSYIQALERDNSVFGKDIKRDICGSENVENDTKKAIKAYMRDLENYVLGKYTSQNNFYSAVNQINSETYSELNKDQARENLNTLRQFEAVVNNTANDYSKNLAKSIFIGAPNINTSDAESYHIEHLLKSDEGAMHPTSVRYILYKLLIEVKGKLQKLNADLNLCKDNLVKYQPGYVEDENSSEFDIEARVSKDKEKNLDTIAELASYDSNKIQTMFGGYGDLFDKLNGHMNSYSSHALNSMKNIVLIAVYNIALEYLESICQEYENFFDSFPSKADSIIRKKDDIVEGLTNRKGSNIYYLCATEEKLEEISKRSVEGTRGFLLPSKLNCEIFEAVKKNSELRRLRNYDKYAEGTYTDIFDAILLSYFKNEVREDSQGRINKNIIDAVFFDKELETYIDSVKYNHETDYQLQKLNDNERELALKEAFRKGEKLASPGINGVSFNEPRDIRICTFSDSLLAMRDIRIKDFAEGNKIQPIPSDTVSRYEIRFFNAIYNITPDDIPLFKGPKYDKVTGDINNSDTGIYFRAYQNYGKLIGPDSMKSSTISTHIDKRWDAIVELPEIDFDVQYDEMIKAHSALIYGLVLGIIRKFPSSKYDKKRVFKLIGDEGEHIDLIVSNGTECDEFYEVLDAIYRDKESANRIIEIAENYTNNDVEKNYSYIQSAFVRFLESFRIPDNHNKPTSLFEIPLAYYNSMPSSMIDTNEISIMIDAVIHILDGVVKKLEKPENRKAYLCNLLEEQYWLLVKTFNNDEIERAYNIRKNTNIYDNIVISMVTQKIIKKLKEVDVSDCSLRVEKLYDVIREPESSYI